MNLGDQREVQTRNALSAAHLLVRTEQGKAARFSENLTHFQQVVRGISYDFESAPDSMGKSIPEYFQLLETIVRRSTVQSLEGIPEILRAAGRSDSPELHRAIDE